MTPEPTPRRPGRRRWFQFSLRFLIIAVTGMCILVGVQSQKYQRQNAAVDELLRRGATVYYDYQHDDSGQLLPNFATAKPRGPQWLRGVIGEEYFYKVVYVNCPGSNWDDEDAPLFLDLPWLRFLSFRSPVRISDRGMEILSRCSCLNFLRLVSDPGPNCAITDDSIPYFKRMSHMGHCQIGGTKITAQGCRELLESIKQVSISGRGVAWDGSTTLIVRIDNH